MSGGNSARIILMGKLPPANGTERNKEIIERDIVKLNGIDFDLNKANSRNHMNKIKFGFEENKNIMLEFLLKKETEY